MTILIITDIKATHTTCHVTTVGKPLMTQNSADLPRESVVFAAMEERQYRPTPGNAEDTTGVTLNECTNQHKSFNDKN